MYYQSSFPRIIVYQIIFQISSRLEFGKPSVFNSFASQTRLFDAMPVPPTLLSNQKTLNLTYSSMPEFKHTLFSCFDDITTCLLAEFVPCVTYAKTEQKLKGKDDCVGDCLCISAVLVLCWPAACYMCCNQRTRVRQKHSIEGICFGEGFDNV